ncbi:MAG: hypothetical protein RL885_01715 [Planctomycetota bacterium]
MTKLMIVTAAMLAALGSSGPLFIEEEPPAPDPSEFVEFRYDADPSLGFLGEWQGEDLREVTSVEEEPGRVRVHWIQLDRARFVVDSALVGERFQRGQRVEVDVPSSLRLALTVNPEGEVAPRIDYRAEADLASPEGHPAALGTRKSRQVDGSTHRISKAVYISDREKVVGYQASPGTLTIEENAVRFGVELEVTEPYGLLMARRANGDLYFWLVPGN